MDSVNPTAKRGLAMRNIIGISAAMLALCLLAGTAHAQATRTWVSGVGDDANPCSRTAPCKTFAGAISKTAAGGEIDALDPGGFGAVTITKAITIDGGGGPVASVLVAGTNGIVVQAGPSDIVTLRNIRINGIGSGLNGIRFLAGKALIVEDCYIFGFTQNGVDVALGSAGAVTVKDTQIANNGGVGIRVTTTAGGVAADISRVRAQLNGTGFQMVGGGGGTVAALIDHSDASLNSIGVQGTTATMLLGNSVVAGNGIGVSSMGGATILSYKNNEINGNPGGDGTPLTQVQLN
jgi:hypothetical protein